MEKYLGISLIIISLIVAFRGIYGKQNKAAIIFFCLFSSFLGLIFMFYDRILEVTIENVGSIKAAAIQAKSDAGTITGLKNRIENQAATIDMVARQAAEAQRMINDLTQKNTFADEKLIKLDKTIGKTSKTLSELHSLIDFSTVVLNAHNDDGLALDKLMTWSDDKSYHYSSRAKEAVITIFNTYSSSMAGITPIDWFDWYDPSKLKTFNDIRKRYETVESYEKPSIISYLWKNKAISEKEKMPFIVTVSLEDISLSARNAAGGIINQEIRDSHIHPFDKKEILKWWDKNKDKYK